MVAGKHSASLAFLQSVGWRLAGGVSITL
jgi:hypothetical protein